MARLASVPEEATAQQQSAPSQTPSTEVESVATLPSAAELSPATVDRAARILARYIGPIAVVLAKRAAQRADSPRAFYRSLAEELDNKADRARFLQDAGFPDA
jgi:serine/threonine-protein kinase